MGVKAVIFGLWETLGTKHFSVSKVLREHFGIENYPDFLEKYEKSIQLKEWKDQETMVKSFLKTFNININSENINFVIEIINKGIDNATLFEGMEDILERLKGKYRLAILSNTTNFESNVVNRWNIDRFFDEQIYSWKVNYLKPSENNFIVACEKLGVLLNECIFVDNEERSTKVAKECGFKVIKFTTVPELKKNMDFIII